MVSPSTKLVVWVSQGITSLSFVNDYPLTLPTLATSTSRTMARGRGKRHTVMPKTHTQTHEKSSVFELPGIATLSADSPPPQTLKPSNFKLRIPPQTVRPRTPSPVPQQSDDVITPPPQ